MDDPRIRRDDEYELSIGLCYPLGQPPALTLSEYEGSGIIGAILVERPPFTTGIQRKKVTVGQLPVKVVMRSNTVINLPANPESGSDTKVVTVDDLGQSIDAGILGRFRFGAALGVRTDVDRTDGLTVQR